MTDQKQDQIIVSVTSHAGHEIEQHTYSCLDLAASILTFAALKQRYAPDTLIEQVVLDSFDDKEENPLDPHLPQNIVVNDRVEVHTAQHIVAWEMSETSNCFGTGE